MNDYWIRAKCYLDYSSLSINANEIFQAKVEVFRCYAEEKWEQNHGYNDVNCFNILWEFIEKHDNNVRTSWMTNYYAEFTCGNLAYLMSLSSILLSHVTKDASSENDKKIKETLTNIINLSKELSSVNITQKMHVHHYYKELRFDPGAGITEHCQDVYIFNIRSYAENLLKEFEALIGIDTASPIEL